MGIAETYSRGRRFVIEHPFALALVVIIAVLLDGLPRGLATGQTQLADIGTFVWGGLVRGLVVGLVGIGLPITHSILSFASFSHGDYITAGASSGWVTTYLIAGLGRIDIGAFLFVGAGKSVCGETLGIGTFSTPLTVVAGIVVSGGFAIALLLTVDCTIFKPIQNEDGIMLLITSVGVAFAFHYLMQFVFGSDVRGTTAQPSSLSLDFIDGTVLINAHDITPLVVASALMLDVHALLQRTKLGKTMHAMADNKDLTLITSIPTECAARATWIIGDGLIGVAGYMLILWKGTLGFNDGWLLLLLIFTMAILGGIGSIYGAIAGGLVTGLMASMSALWILLAFSRVVTFVVMIVILFMKSPGLFSGRATA